MKTRVALAALLAGITLAACGGSPPETRAAGDEAPLPADTIEATETTVTTVAGAPATTTTTPARTTATTVASSSTTATLSTSSPDLAAAEAAKQAKESADRAEESAQRAEEAAKAATSTTTTVAPTTATTAPKVYGWVEVARFHWDGGSLSGPPLRADATLQGGKLRVTGVIRQPNSIMTGPIHKFVYFGEDNTPSQACPATEDNKATTIDYYPATTPDCAWRGAWPAGPAVIRLGWNNGSGWVAPFYNEPDVTVEEWRVIG